MTNRLAHIWRHPIKSHGREEIETVSVAKGKTLPWDRTWAIAHEAARMTGQDWAPCANFSRCAKAPSLMAITAKMDEATETVTLSHPDRPDITVHPERDAAQLLDWVRPLMPEDRAQSAQVVRIPGRGMTDSDFPSISINNLASHRAVEQRLGQSLDPARWRGNFIMEGLALWEEFEWVGKSIAIGTAEFEVIEPIERCLATTANPQTGLRDADTLGALDSFGHRDFGVRVMVTKGGTVSSGDTLRVL